MVIRHIYSLWTAGLAGVALAACSPGPAGPPVGPSHTPPPGTCEPGNPPVVEIGVPDDSYLQFLELPAGGDVPLSATGQGFLTVQIAVRGSDVPRIVDLTMGVTVTGSGATGETTETVELVCHDDGFRYVIPFVLDAAYLGDPASIQDQPVSIDVTLHDPDDQGFEVADSATGVLRLTGQ